MRIAYLTFDFGVPLVGTRGSTIHVRQVTRALRHLGHEVTVYSPNPGPEGDDGFVAVPLASFALEADRLLKRDGADLPSHLRRELRRVVYAEHAQRKLAPVLAAARPDFMYERYSLFGYGGIELAKSLGVPHVLEVNSPLAMEAAKHRGLVLQDTASEMEARIWRNADALLVVSRALAEHASSLGVPKERIEVVTTGVDAEAFHPGVGDGGARSRMSLEDKQVVGFVGSLRPWHDLETLVQAVRLLNESGESAHLLVVGEGPPLDWLREVEDGFVTCTGAVPHEGVPGLQASMDVVAVPYAAEGDPYFSPIKMYEAMAMEKPVVGARVGQVAETLVDGETGVLYDPGDAADLARKVAWLLESRERAAAIGSAARRVVLADHTWRSVAERVVATADRLLAARDEP